MQKFLSELQRRSVLRVASGYVVAGWVILQVALSLQAAMKLPEWFSTVIVSLLIIGFPIAVVVSWFFEFTPDGIKRTVPSNEIARFKPQTADFALAAGLFLVLAAVVVQFNAPPAPVTATTAPQATEPAIAAASIAVLPFADLSPAKDQEYFSDGMAEEILNVLAKVKGLDVASRISSFQFKGREIGVPEIAKQLRVRHVVEGSVRKAGNMLRITAQLIDTRTDRHLWSEAFDRPLTADNVFAIQDEIAQAIVKALGQAIGAGVDTGKHVAVAPVTDSLTAYELFLQARTLFTARLDLDKADELLKRAVEQDPHFAAALEIRAALQSLMVDYGYWSAAPQEFEKRTFEFANRAIAINPKSATAIAVLAKMKLDAAESLRRRGDFALIRDELERAVDYDPRNVSAINWLGLTYRDVGDLRAALTNFNRCLDIEPYYTPCLINQVITLSSLEQTSEAIAVYRKMLNEGSAAADAPFYTLVKAGLEYEFKIVTGSRGWLAGWRQHDKLYEAYRHPEKDYPELIADIRQFNQKTKQMSDWQLTTLLAPIGGYDGIVDSGQAWEPRLARYRRSAPFKSWIRESGVFDYWRKHGFPPQCRAVGADDFACD